MNLLSPPIEFPSIPFVTIIPGGNRVGLLIRIQGSVRKSASRFAINVAGGPNISAPHSDIGFHFNPRFDTRSAYVARNTLLNGQWDKEECNDPNTMPFTRGAPFEVMILVESLHYKVAVDGRHYLTYRHRIPIESLDTLQIMGDIKISKLEFLDSSPPQPVYGFQQAPMEFVQPPLEVFEPEVPFVQEIPGNNRIGLRMRIHGKVPKHAKEFIVNIAAGPSILEPLSDIGFSFNARFDRGYVARNSLIGQEWGEEENDNPDDLPFNRREHFEIVILVESNHYKVEVDGSYFLKYRHRTPIELLNTLQILGDVRIKKIEFQDTNPTAVYGFAPQLMNLSQPQEILNPIVPYRQALQGGMQLGKTIFITGRPKPYATRFSINLENAREVDADIIFHFNPRFGGMGDEVSSVIVRNNRQNGKWGFEEKDTPSFPFFQGFNFDLTIVCEQEFYSLAVNGQHLLSFRHRVPFEYVDTLYVVGDVDIMAIRC